MVCLPIGRRRHGFGLMIVKFAIILGLTLLVVLPAHASLVSGECDQAHRACAGTSRYDGA